MSAKSLALLAVDRDATPPGQSVASDSTDVLVAVVPTEALAAYTAVIGVVLAGNIGTAYGSFRWFAYGTFIALAVLAPVVLFRNRASETHKDTRKLPVPECLTAGVAAAAWGLVMPGSPLTLIIKGNALVFATTAILVSTAAILSLAAQILRTANSRNAAPTDGAGPATEEEEAPPAAADEVAPVLAVAGEARGPVASSGALMSDDPDRRWRESPTPSSAAPPGPAFTPPPPPKTRPKETGQPGGSM